MEIKLTNIQRICFIAMVLMVSMFNYSEGMLDALTNVSVILFVGVTFVAANWKITMPREMKYFAVFMAFCVTSLLFSTAQSASMNRVVKLMIMAMELMAVYIYAKQEDKDFLMKVIAAATTLTAVFIDIKGIETIGNTKRVNNITGDSNQVSAYLVFGILVMIYLLFVNKKKIWIPGIAASVIAIVLQGSRTAILVAGFMAVVELILLVRYMKLSLSKRLALFMLLIIAMSITVYYIISNPILYMALGRRFMSLYEIRTTGSSSMNETSVFNRAHAYRYALERFMANPVFGRGIDTFAEFSRNSDLNKVSFCPNNYLELLQGIGIFGTVAYYLMYFNILNKSITAKKHRISESSVLVICILLAMLLMHITVVFYYQKLEYLYLGVMLAMCLGFCEKEVADDI